MAYMLNTTSRAVNDGGYTIKKKEEDTYNNQTQRNEQLAQRQQRTSISDLIDNTPSTSSSSTTSTTSTKPADTRSAADIAAQRRADEQAANYQYAVSQSANTAQEIAQQERRDEQAANYQAAKAQSAQTAEQIANQRRQDEQAANYQAALAQSAQTADAIAAQRRADEQAAESLYAEQQAAQQAAEQANARQDAINAVVESTPEHANDQTWTYMTPEETQALTDTIAQNTAAEWDAINTEQELRRQQQEYLDGWLRRNESIQNAVAREEAAQETTTPTVQPRSYEPNDTESKTEGISTSGSTAESPSELYQDWQAYLAGQETAETPNDEWDTIVDPTSALGFGYVTPTTKLSSGEYRAEQAAPDYTRPTMGGVLTPAQLQGLRGGTPPTLSNQDPQWTTAFNEAYAKAIADGAKGADAIAFAEDVANNEKTTGPAAVAGKILSDFVDSVSEGVSKRNDLLGKIIEGVDIGDNELASFGDVVDAFVDGSAFDVINDSNTNPNGYTPTNILRSEDYHNRGEYDPQNTTYNAIGQEREVGVDEDGIYDRPYSPYYSGEDKIENEQLAYERGLADYTKNNGAHTENNGEVPIAEWIQKGLSDNPVYDDAYSEAYDEAINSGKSYREADALARKAGDKAVAGNKSTSTPETPNEESKENEGKSLFDAIVEASEYTPETPEEKAVRLAKETERLLGNTSGPSKKPTTSAASSPSTTGTNTPTTGGSSTAEDGRPGYNADGTPNDVLASILAGDWNIDTGVDDANSLYGQIEQEGNAERILSAFDTMNGFDLNIPPEIAAYIASDKWNAAGMLDSLAISGDGTILNGYQGATPETINASSDQLNAAMAALVQANPELGAMLNAGQITANDIMRHFFKPTSEVAAASGAGENVYNWADYLNGVPGTTGTGTYSRTNEYFTPSYGQDMTKGVKAPYKEGGYTEAELRAMGNVPYSNNGYTAYEGYYQAPNGNWYPVDQEKAAYYQRYGTYIGWDEGMRDYYNTWGTFYGYTPSWKSTGRNTGSSRNYSYNYSGSGGSSGGRSSSGYYSSSYPSYYTNDTYSSNVNPSTTSQQMQRINNMMINWTF